MIGFKLFCLPHSPFLQLTLHSRTSEESATKTVRTLPAILNASGQKGCIPLIRAPLGPRAIIAASAAPEELQYSNMARCKLHRMPMNDVFGAFTPKNNHSYIGC